MTKETVGKQVYSHLLTDTTTNDHSVIEQMRENLKDYESNLVEAITRGKKEIHGDFFVVVLIKQEKVFDKKDSAEEVGLVFRNYYVTRETCPTPNYDQVVYHYRSDGDGVEFLWSIPSRPTCEYIKEHALKLPKEEHMLRDMVFDFYDDTLLTYAKRLNGEKEGALAIQ